MNASLNAAGAKLKNLLDPRTPLSVETRGDRSIVKVTLAPHGMAILRQG